MPQVGLLFFDQPYNNLTGSYKKFLISGDRVANWGQTYSTHVIFTLWMKGIMLAKWQQLPKIRKHIGQIGPNMSNLWGWTLSYRGCDTRQKCVSSQGLRQESAEASTGKGSKSRLEQLLALSRPLDKKSCWPLGKTPQKLLVANNSSQGCNKFIMGGARRTPQQQNKSQLKLMSWNYWLKRDAMDQRQSSKGQKEPYPSLLSTIFCVPGNAR
jgi:hypothetical protein